MAIRFARQSGNWSDPLTWDGGLTIPTTGDEVYLNGFNISVNQDVTVGFITNKQTPTGVPQSFIPNMLSNTSPNTVGQAFAGQNNLNAWYAFRKNIDTFTPSGLFWQGVGQTGQLGYQFNTPKSIQRYSWISQPDPVYRPKNFTFEGSNDGVSWTILHTVVNTPNVVTYVSPPISNPTSYIYYRINVSACQTLAPQYSLVINSFDMSETTDVSNGYLQGGTVTVSVSRTINTNIYAGTGTLLNITATSPNVISINGSVLGDFSTQLSGAVYGINMTGNATINVVGNIRGGLNGFFTEGIRLGVGATLNLTGDVSAGLSGAGLILVGIRSTNNATINVVGNVTGALNGYGNFGIILGNNDNVNITGQVSGGYGSTTSQTNRGISAAGNGGLVTIVGSINGGTRAPALFGGETISTPFRLNGNVQNAADGSAAVYTPFFFIESTTQYEFRKFNLTTNTLYTPGVNTGHPAESNVRNGITYGPTNTLTGTCFVPSASTVSLGVPVDNTVGTAELTASDMWNYDLVNVNNQPGTVGYKLKKIQPQIIMNIGNIVT